MPLGVRCTNEEKVHVRLNPTTTTGRPATLDGKASFSTISGEGTAVVDEDGLGAFLISGDNPGDTTFLVEADADLGAGVVSIQDTVTLEVRGAFAANLGLIPDPPVAK